MRKGNDDTAKRRSIMLPDSYVEEMGKVRELIGAQSDSEVIRRALKLYSQLLEPQNEITVKNKSTGQSHVVMLT